MVKEFIKSVKEVLDEAAAACNSIPDSSTQCASQPVQSDTSAQHVSRSVQSVPNTPTANQQPVPMNHDVPITNTITTNLFADYLFRALRNVPTSINLQSQHSAHNIQVIQKKPYEFRAKLYKKDASVEISKSKFIFEIQSWLNNSLSTVHFDAQRDLASIDQRFNLEISNLNTAYMMNVAQYPDNKAFIDVQSNISKDNAMYMYNIQFASMQHLLYRVQVINMEDYGDYVIATFQTSKTYFCNG